MMNVMCFMISTGAKEGARLCFCCLFFIISVVYFGSGRDCKCFHPECNMQNIFSVFVHPRLYSITHKLMNRVSLLKCPQ